MIRRRSFLTTAIAASAALGLAACSDDPDPKNPASDAGGASDGAGASDAGGAEALSAVTVSEDLGAAPTVDFSAPLTITAPAAKLVVKGKGAAISDGDHIIWRSMYVDAQNGKTLQSWWEGAPASGVTVTEQGVGPAAHSFLTSATVGSRFVMAGWQQDQTGQARALLQVADIDRVVPLRAKGEPAAPAEGVPQVQLGDNGAPSLKAAPSGEPPQETTVTPLITGTGEKTAPGDYLTMQYTGWTWDDGKQFDSSWDRGQPFGFVLGSGQVVAGWDKHLGGLPVGSQVMLVIPPKDGYGEEKNDQMPLAGRTLVFVVDVLDAAKPHR